MNAPTVTDLDYGRAGITVGRYATSEPAVYAVRHDGATWLFGTHREAHEYATERYLELVSTLDGYEVIRVKLADGSWVEREIDRDNLETWM